MSVSDPISDMLTKVRNASMARHEKVDIPTSRLKLEIVKILKTEGFIKNFKKIVQENQNFIRVFLKYDEENEPILHGIEKVSKPG
ncbi:MAG TPA: 30S ribosomal protein S8, partial [Spirochaetales bacterium]|nr:30S ribosomal protein S8 [Spirochaetales bacterium]